MNILDEQYPELDYRQPIRREIRNFLLGLGLFALPLALLFSYWFWELLDLAPGSLGVLGLTAFMLLFGWAMVAYLLRQLWLLQQDYYGYRLESYRAIVKDSGIDYFQRNGRPSYQIHLAQNASGYTRCEVDVQLFRQLEPRAEVELVVGKYSKLLFKVTQVH